MLVPEIVTAVGLLMTFSKLYRPALDVFGLGQSSLSSLVAGHLSFGLAYVVVIVKARLSHLDTTLELAAQNLGASKIQTFWLITLPQLIPAVVCGFLLVFTLSLDDFYLSHFLTYGGSGYTTLPVYLFGLQSRSGLTPEMNAVASLMVMVSLTLVAVTVLFYSRWVNKGVAKHA
jgi:ABC-type spermidine/putrescine transport system permease subunit II